MADITGTGARDSLSGGAGADVLTGLDGADVLAGGAGDDVLWGHSAAGADPAAALVTAARVAQGLAAPLFAASPPGEPNRLFVVEQHTGRILILDLNSGVVAATPFLDLPDNQLATGNEQGLLGLAFHPDYATNGRFFIDITNAAGDIEIWEYRRATGDPNRADAASATPVLSFAHPQSNHNGGWMAFGPDGYLYVASGDGGGSGDPQNFAQNTSSLLGKILRLDVNADAFPADPTRNYAIPAGNPFAATAGADEIWALGLRNPWRPSFDTANGDFYIADVGQGAREELDYLTAGTGAGANFGWRFREGTLPFQGTAPLGLIEPVLDYDRSAAGGQSVTGGYVYHGPGGWQGLYVFGDFVSGNLWTARIANGAAQDFLPRKAQLVVTGGGDIDQIASFALDGQGRLYLVGLDGDIHRLTPGAAAGDAADTLSGGDGNDRLAGGPGSDQLDGGPGFDTAVFAGASTGYSWSQAGDGSWTVTDTSTGAPQGADRLTGVERLEFADRTVALVASTITPEITALFAGLLRVSADLPAYQVQASDLSLRISQGTLTLAGATGEVVDRADATTSVATLSYQFFTGHTPSAAGLDYLVSPTGPNPNNLNSAYYQGFSLENRYINFAVNLGKLGEGAPTFLTQYGGLSLFDATKAAYATIFGAAPSDAKAHALIDTRVGYFSALGGDGATGIGTKAAMVGWLLAEAAKADIGMLARSNEAFLTDFADGATTPVDLVGVYGQPGFIFDGG